MISDYFILLVICILLYRKWITSALKRLLLIPIYCVEKYFYDAINYKDNKTKNVLLTRYQTVEISCRTYIVRIDSRNIFKNLNEMKKV